MVVEQSDLLASLGYHRAGDLSLSSWLSSLRASAQRLAWFARDDLAPFLLMCVQFLLRGVQRASDFRQAVGATLRHQGMYRRDASDDDRDGAQRRLPPRKRHGSPQALLCGPGPGGRTERVCELEGLPLRREADDAPRGATSACAEPPEAVHP